MTAMTFTGISTVTVTLLVPRAQDTDTGPRSVHCVPPAYLRPSVGGSMRTCDAPGAVTVMPSSVCSISTMPAAPQPCEKLSLLLWLTALPRQEEIAQPGVHCSHRLVPPSARI